MPKQLPRISAARIILLLTAIVVGYFLFLSATNFVRSFQLDEQEKQLGAEVERLQERYQRLQALRDYLNSDEYVEAVAREQLGLVRPGEVGIVVISPPPVQPEDGDKKEEDEEAVEQRLWWEMLIRQ